MADAHLRGMAGEERDAPQHMSEDKGFDLDELVSESGDESSQGSSGSEEEEEAEEEAGSWIAWFCSLKGNEFFAEVEEEYIQDDFNLSGLSSQVPYYEYALDLILDSESLQNEILTEAQQELVETAAEALYGLIHARYVLTSRGMNAMLEKFKGCDFGRCPRVFCNGQACLPVGLSDVPRQATVKLFCPKCEDVFYPRSKYHGNLDGAYFGTTFPHLFLLTYPTMRPPKPAETYLPRVFGFKIHPSAYQRERGRQPGPPQQQQQQQPQQEQQQSKQRRSGGGASSQQQRSSNHNMEDQEQQQQEQQPGGSGKRLPSPPLPPPPSPGRSGGRRLSNG
ncbi:hypothetical protein N2152v2_003776 [Parachlorella kessleri]